MFLTEDNSAIIAIRKTLADQFGQKGYLISNDLNSIERNVYQCILYRLRTTQTKDEFLNFLYDDFSELNIEFGEFPPYIENYLIKKQRQSLFNLLKKITSILEECDNDDYKYVLTRVLRMKHYNTMFRNILFGGISQAVRIFGNIL